MSENDSGQPQELKPQLPEKLTIEEDTLGFTANPEPKSEKTQEELIPEKIDAEEEFRGKENFPGTEVTEVPSVVKENPPEQLFEEYIQARKALDEADKNDPVVLGKAGEKNGSTKREKEIMKKFEERISSKEGKEKTAFGLLEEIFDNGIILENRAELMINGTGKNDALEHTLKEKSYVSLDDLKILEFLLDSDSGVEIKGMPKGPKEKELTDKLNEFTVLQRHLVHLAGEIPMVDIEKRRKDLNNEIKKLHERRNNLFSEILQHKNELSGRNEVRENGKQNPEPAAEKIEIRQGHAIEYLDQMFGKIGDNGKVERVGIVEEALKKGKDVYVELKPQAIGKLLEQTLDIQTPDGVKVDIFSIRQEFELKEEKKRIKLSFNASVKKDRKLLGIKVPGVSRGMNGEMVIGEAPEDLPNSNIAVSELITNPAKVYGKDTKNLFKSYLGGEGFENSNDRYFKTRIKEGIDSIIYTMTDEGNLRVDFKAKKTEVKYPQTTPSILTPPELQEEVADEEQKQNPVEVQETTSVPAEEIGKEPIENTSKSEETEREKLTPIDYILDADPKDVFVYKLKGEVDGEPTEDYAIFQLQRMKDKPGLLHISIFTPKEGKFVKTDSIEINDLNLVKETADALAQRMLNETGLARWQSDQSVGRDIIGESLKNANISMKESIKKYNSKRIN